MPAQTKTTPETTPARMGPPLGNANRTTHGIRAWRECRRLPKGCEALQSVLDDLEGRIGQRMRQQYGEITEFNAYLIELFITHEGRRLLGMRYRRARRRQTTAEKIGISKEIGNAGDSAAKCLSLLGLDRTKPLDPWDAIDNPPVAPTDASGRNGSDPTAETAEASMSLSVAHTANGEGPDWQEYPGDHEVSTSGAACLERGGHDQQHGQTTGPSTESSP